jgi:hypothetical protein
VGDRGEPLQQSLDQQHHAALQRQFLLVPLVQAESLLEVEETVVVADGLGEGVEDEELEQFLDDGLGDVGGVEGGAESAEGEAVGAGGLGLDGGVEDGVLGVVGELLDDALDPH